ncbi:MAG TPA: pitrilysin family protein [Terriglobales bacterium]|nr:pitrilysin family protein [Terriglobales bacterium]
MKLRSFLNCFLLAAALAGNLLAADHPGPGLPPVKFTDTRLDNGLRVILAPDHTAPVLAIDVTYDVGSRNERPGRTGFAHLFEHMMFQGSENVGKGEHFSLLENNGGEFNGTTNEDRTTYFEILPKNQLDLALFLESDRMGKLAVNQANLDNQRNAVQEERRLGIDNQPYGKSELEIDSLAYDCFNYKHSTIGSMSDLNAASLEDVKDFFRIYYAPNNAVLSLVGDFDANEALEKIKKYYENIPRQPTAPKALPCEEERYGERREIVMDPLARLPMVMIAYQIPAGNTPDNYALQALGNILGTGESSRLYQHLVKDKQLATAVQVQVDARRDTSLLYIISYPRPGVKPEELEAAIYDDISAVAKNGITSEELQKAQMQYRRREVQTRESALRTALRLGHDAIYFNDPQLINTAIEKYNATTPDDVKKVAGKYFAANQRAVVTTLPQPGAQPESASQGGQQ